MGDVDDARNFVIVGLFCVDFGAFSLFAGAIDGPPFNLATWRRSEAALRETGKEAARKLATAERLGSEGLLLIRQDKP